MPSRNAVVAHPPNVGLEDMGFVPRGEASRYIPERNAGPGGRLSLNTNGGACSQGSASAPKMPAHGARGYRPTGSGMEEQKTLPGS